MLPEVFLGDAVAEAAGYYWMLEEKVSRGPAEGRKGRGGRRSKYVSNFYLASQRGKGGGTRVSGYRERDGITQFPDW